MASPHAMSLGSGGVGIGRVAEAGRRQALAVLLTGEPNAHDPAVDEFLAFGRSQNLELGELWAATDAQRVLAAALLVPSAGRTGMLFLSPLRSRDRAPLATEVTRALMAAQDPAALRLAQGLLDPHQSRERDALLAAGFTHLADLVYMQRATERLGLHLAEGDFGRELTLVHYAEDRRPLFERAILASYEDTLDCPGLLGLRDIGDIVDGHIATGRFDPQMWSVLLAGDGEPAAVMLLNELPQRSAVELVYLGLPPAWRGRGLARRLLQHGVDAAARRGAATFLLAVDHENAPALKLYRDLGFRPTARKVAMIRALPPIS